MGSFENPLLPLPKGSGTVVDFRDPIIAKSEPRSNGNKQVTP